MFPRTFYRTVIQVEILSEEPYNASDLQQVAADITDGDCSGRVSDVVRNEEKTGAEMARLLQAQGSAPAFFQLEEDGTSVYDTAEAEDAGGPDISQLVWQPPEAMQRNQLYLVRRKTGSTSPGKEPVLALYFVGFIGLSRQDVFDTSNAEACVALAEIDAVAKLSGPATATPSSSSTRGASMRR